MARVDRLTIETAPGNVRDPILERRQRRDREAPMSVRFSVTASQRLAATPAITERRALSLFAAVTLIIALTATFIHWPVPRLEYIVDPASGIITELDPGGPADVGGLRLGDRILWRYWYAWTDLERQFALYPLTWSEVTEIRFVVERDGRQRTIVFPPSAPSLAYQLEKAANLLLALICWVTGYVLGLMRRHESFGTILLSWFWFGMAGTLGCYLFVHTASYPLAVAVAWIMLSILLPLGVYVHLWYPARAETLIDRRSARRLFLTFIIAVQTSGLLALLVFRPAPSMMRNLLHDLLPAGVILALLGVGGILWRSYRRTHTAHARRQIRLIAAASIITAAAWLALRLAPRLLGVEQVVHSSWTDLMSGFIPLAYVLGGVLPDLYRIDRAVLRLGFYGLLSLTVFGVAFGIMQLSADPLGYIWAAVSMVALTGPVSQWLLRLTPLRLHLTPNYEPLHIAAGQLATTLDRDHLIQHVIAGVQQAFDQPPVAFFVPHPNDVATLTLATRDRLPVADTLPPGALLDALKQMDRVVESRTLTALAETESSDLDALAPGAVLWCPIRHAHGDLLGLLVLGMRGDLDPYRSEDVYELQRLVDATMLAFINSAAYAEQTADKEMIRQLYHHVQQVQHETARRIARELHDEHINGNLRYSILALRQLLLHSHTPDVRHKLEAMLEGQLTLYDALRDVCIDLYPTGIDKPFGLSTVLQNHIDREQNHWCKPISLIVTGEPCLVAADVQRAALRIAQEAITNAVKHSGATKIVAQLEYPSCAGEMVTLHIADDGIEGIIAFRSGHLGLHTMHEHARSAGGTLVIQQDAGGHRVVFRFPAIAHEHLAM